MRTAQLDKHWAGYWYCCSCHHYTGQLNLHENHDLTELPPSCEDCAVWRLRGNKEMENARFWRRNSVATTMVVNDIQSKLAEALLKLKQLEKGDTRLT